MFWRERNTVTKQRRISVTTRKELIEAVGARYRSSPKSERKKILDEFVALTGCHRKHAIRTLSREPAGEHDIVKDKILQVSAATIDRKLADTRSHIDGQRKRRRGVGAAIRRSIPVRTFSDWCDPPPGFLEIDMVEHTCGPKTDGDYVHTLVLTDIASGWTE